MAPLLESPTQLLSALPAVPATGPRCGCRCCALLRDATTRAATRAAAADERRQVAGRFAVGTITHDSDSDDDSDGSVPDLRPWSRG
jgi:hypothetical protein